ncbi:NACHT domain-containing protein [Actinosynnema sp. CA-299493]
MRPALFTYAGALRLLGEYDRPRFDALNIALGGAILAGGALGGPGVLGLVDPKNEAMTSLRRILDGVSAKLTGLTGVNRQELVSAAHTVIAVNAVFDAFRDRLGRRFDRLDITDREKSRILGVEPTGTREVAALPGLAALRVPMPGATRGFEENLDHDLTRFFTAATGHVQDFLNGLADPPMAALVDPTQPIVVDVREKYVHHYLGLAAQVPEFRIWTLIGEHSATRAAIEAGGRRVEELLTVQTESLERFSRLLSMGAPKDLREDRSYRRKLGVAARAALAKPLLRTNPDTPAANASFPTVERGFVAPGYRVIVHDEESNPSSDDWWSTHAEVREDIDTFLAAHLSTPDSTVRPLLVLGHPGAGKSLLMTVLAARLPAAGYTVVTVQLRKVYAENTVARQIEAALTEVLAERVDWGRLADECADSIRVVLLDGFDELVQASGVTQSTYLQQVLDFQEREADLERPVAVVITSRTLVVDRARIPHGVPVVKLEEFDDRRIDKWLAAWNEANASSPDFRELDSARLLHHGDLARQPLILLMLAIYAADADNPDLDAEDLSQAKLYERLIDSFVLRQARDKTPVPRPGQHVAKQAKRSKRQLGLAALAMFNRGRQYVTDAELNQDLTAFSRGPDAARHGSFDDPLSPADQTVEDFFFIHSAKLGKQGQAGSGRRTIEFLHATFGEYLIAEVSLTLLGKVATERGLRESDPFERFSPLDDALLFALVSHQPFTKRKPILEFASGLFRALDQEVRGDVLDTLDELIHAVHERVTNDHHRAYAPSPATLVARVATYSANLVCLRVVLDDSGVPLERLFPTATDALADWRAMVRLWRAGLDDEGWQTLLDTLVLDPVDGGWRLFSESGSDLLIGYRAAEAQLLGDPELEGILRTGTVFADSTLSSRPQDQGLLEQLAYWIFQLSGTATAPRMLPDDITDLRNMLASIEAGARLRGNGWLALIAALSRESWRLPLDLVQRALKQLVTDPDDTPPGPVGTLFELVAIACSHPEVLEDEDLFDRLLRWVEARPTEDLGALVLVWLTTARTDRQHPGLHRLFQCLLESARRTVNEQGWNWSRMPHEVFEYFASPDAADWEFGSALLRELAEGAQISRYPVDPRHHLTVVERFARSSSATSLDEAKLIMLVQAGLPAPASREARADLTTAMEALRRLVEDSARPRP